MVCPACRKDITRVLSDSSHVPRWKKSSSERECCVQMCVSEVFASFHNITDSDKIKGVFHSCGLVCSTETIPIPVPLCKHHHHMVYNETQPHQEHIV